MSFNWYIVHALSGSEKKVKQAIIEQAEKRGLSDLFEEILIPAAMVPEIKKGKQVNIEKKFLPGYMMIKMNLTDEAWHIVKSVPKVSGFLGSGGKPLPVSEKEVQRIMDQVNDNPSIVATKKIFEEGEKIKVIDGPFESFSGTIEEVDLTKMRLRVSVSIFGRATPIELSFSQVERL
ncbi:MAG: transcription termination/antitermination protein NusG [Rickettsiaceae bacterium]|nr:transcription termination/antitermination protein NusG [Rickettsiaceae bacterium]